MNITVEEKAILAHVVIDPDDWVAHALSTVGEQAVTAKIERWRPDYLAQKDLPGYKDRAKRDKDADDAKKPTQEQIDRATVENLIQVKLREFAIAALKAEGKLDANGKPKK